MKNKFLNISIGVSMIILCSAFFVRSITPANAAPPSPKEFIDGGTNLIGKYQMQLSTNIYNDNIYYFAMVWDTETGKSKIYKSSKGTFEVFTDEEGLPANPMGN